MASKFNKYRLIDGTTVFLNPDHIVSAVMRKDQMRWEADITDSRGKGYTVSHPDYSALMFIIVNGIDERNPI